MISFEFADGLLAGLAVAVGVYLVLWWRARRGAAGELPPAGAVWSSAEDAGTAAPPGFPLGASSHLLASVESGPTVPVGLLSFSGLTPVPDLPLPLGVPGGPAPPPTLRPSMGSATFRLSHRVLLHVYAQGALPPGAVAPPGLCQAGMVDALGLPQAGLAAVLRRLEAAGMFTTERGHVRGRDRRLKIYRLSSRGLQVAEELRQRTRRPPPR